MTPNPFLFFMCVLQSDSLPPPLFRLCVAGDSPPPFFCLCCKQLPHLLFFVYAQNSIMLHVSYFQCLNSPLPFLYLCLELPILSQFMFLTSKAPTSPPPSSSSFVPRAPSPFVLHVFLALNPTPSFSFDVSRTPKHFTLPIF